MGVATREKVSDSGHVPAGVPSVMFASKVYSRYPNLMAHPDRQILGFLMTKCNRLSPLQETH